MTNKQVLYQGLDVHAENIAVAITEAGRDGEVRSHGIISSDLQNVEKLLRDTPENEPCLRLPLG